MGQTDHYRWEEVLLQCSYKLAFSIHHVYSYAVAIFPSMLDEKSWRLSGPIEENGIEPLYALDKPIPALLHTSQIRKLVSMLVYTLIITFAQ